MQRKLIKIFFLLVIAILLVGLWSFVQSPYVLNKGEMRSTLVTIEEKSQPEILGFQFLKKNLQDKNGVLAYSVSSLADAAFCVSESMGQAMEYAALSKDRTYFEEIAKAADRYFLDPLGYYYWKLDLPGYYPATTSALIDDLRIFKAYYLANSYKLGDYQQRLIVLSDNLYRTGIKDGYPSDYYDAQSGEKANEVSLFYLDAQIFQMLTQVDEKKWEQPFQNTCDILLNIPENRNGFYPPKYRLTTKQYVWGETVNMVENLYTALHLNYAGGDVKPFVRFLKKQIREEGRIYNWYYLTGTKSDPNESTAVYALAARLLAQNGEKSAAAWCYGKVKDFQMTESHTFQGGFGDEDSKMVYAFDQLEALIMMRMVSGENE